MSAVKRICTLCHAPAVIVHHEFVTHDGAVMQEVHTYYCAADQHAALEARIIIAVHTAAEQYGSSVESVGP